MAADNVALLGAGFSRNWGAPLASEVANDLVQQVGGDDLYLQTLLTKNEKNFETALSQIQGEYISSPSSPERRERLEKLQGAIGSMFEKLNASFEGLSDFEFSNDQHFSVTKFLARFDAIFGLNQDMLLELRYAEAMPLASGMRWNAFQLPGMNRVNDPSLIGIGDKHKRQWKPGSEFVVQGGAQPYFKLHGSSNWHTNDGRKLLVMGGNKDLLINELAVLRWYFEQFKSYLSRPDTRLMVIGYSFGDQHINNAIVEAWRNGTLAGMFLVNPAGREVLNPTRHHTVGMRSDLEDIPNLGGSVRVMSATFAGDDYEHRRFVEFFQ
jgi:hypothetical protein